ncbi:MAG TPA: hypothetical protein VK074_10195 [Fodinibius sp.]|nr:hypothetical protein [Fodinibius sp.]
MLKLPFNISRSLSSYVEHFEEDPEKATHRLKEQLENRGPDAVGYFLLAWFYHLRDMREKAVEEALRARIFAPGSTFFKRLHYYLSHPDQFEAWTSDPVEPRSRPSTSAPIQRGPVLDLDSLIQRLSDVNTHRIQPDKAYSGEMETGKKNPGHNDLGNIVSETLAKIHEKQGKIDTAIRSYQQLKRIKKEKREYFNQQINRLQDIKNNSEEE